MGVYEERILPRVIDIALGRSMESVRARVAAGLSGNVLEVGFGSGRNLPHLPESVTRLIAVDPAVHGRQIAAPRIAASRVAVEFVGLDGQALPLPDASVDNVLVTWTLCTIPDVDRALREMHRVLRPGGSLHFVEHGLSPRPATARRQRRISPWWGRIAGGCHLDRDIPSLVTTAGFNLGDLSSERLAWPELVGRSYVGRAVKG